MHIALFMDTYFPDDTYTQFRKTNMWVFAVHLIGFFMQIVHVGMFKMFVGANTID